MDNKAYAGRSVRIPSLRSPLSTASASTAHISMISVLTMTNAAPITTRDPADIAGIGAGEQKTPPAPTHPPATNDVRAARAAKVAASFGTNGAATNVSPISAAQITTNAFAFPSTS